MVDEAQQEGARPRTLAAVALAVGAEAAQEVGHVEVDGAADAAQRESSRFTQSAANEPAT